MMIYTLSHMSAPQLGPLIGGFINQHTHWRWTFYVLMIWASFCVVSVFFLVPETYHPIVLRAKARNLRKSTGETRWRAPIELEAETGVNLSARIGSSILRPFQLLIFEPMVLNLCILTALVLGIIYLFFGAFGLIFPQNYGFNLEQVGMSFQGLLVGQLAGILTRPFWRWYTPRLIAKKNPNLQIYDDKQRNPVSEPEYRLLPAIFGAVSVSIGLFWFAGTTIPSIHWIVPIIGSSVFGLGLAHLRFPTLVKSPSR